MIMKLNSDQQQTVIDNIGLAYARAFEMSNYRLPLEDRKQAALLGLIKAVRDLDETKSALSSYSWSKIRHEMQAAHRKANDEHCIGSIDASMWFTPTSQMEDDQPWSDLYEDVRAVIKKLSPRDADILVSTVAGEESGDSVGERHGLSRARVHQIKHSAIATIRRELFVRKTATA